MAEGCIKGIFSERMQLDVWRNTHVRDKTQNGSALMTLWGKRKVYIIIAFATVTMASLIPPTAIKVFNRNNKSINFCRKTTTTTEKQHILTQTTISTMVIQINTN